MKTTQRAGEQATFPLAVDMTEKGPKTAGGQSHTHPQLWLSHTNPPHLAHRHSKDAGVQQACGGVGTHLTHKGEPLPPPYTILLHLLPSDRRDEHGASEHELNVEHQPPLQSYQGQGKAPLPSVFIRL